VAGTKPRPATAEPRVRLLTAGNLGGTKERQTKTKSARTNDARNWIWRAKQEQLAGQEISPALQFATILELPYQNASTAAIQNLQYQNK
jgi:hypothetical protein